MTRKLVAWLNLAWHFAVHVVTRLPFRPFRGGADLRRFNDTVQPEGYVALAPAERAEFPRYMACVHCGLCAIPGAATPMSAWDEPWTFVAGASRSIDCAPLVARDIPARVDAPEAGAVCPMGVPIRGMATTLRRLAVLTLLFTTSAMAQSPAQNRPRAREAGVIVGIFPTGQHNAITDVAGVRVGQTTVVEGNVRTGVTAILPHGGNAYLERVPAAVHIANAYGKLAGALQVKELGEIETPILLTCTLCVWKAADAMVEWMLEQPGMENVRSLNALVGETNDGALNDIRSRPIRPEHVRSALANAATGAVAEGAVGAGAGTIAFGWKGGIGTASRVLPAPLGGYTVGVLVQTNYGGILTINGAPVGRELGQYAFKSVVERGERSGTSEPDTLRVAGLSRTKSEMDGSIMIVVATDAPLDARNLERLATRAITGLARTGSSMSNGSGDFVIAFSTDSTVRRKPQNTPRTIQDLPNDGMSGLFQAVAEATEEAIYNSMFKAETVTSNGMTVEALPLDKVMDVLKRYRAVK